MKIGSIGIPHITVADSEALLTQLKTDMQVMVWDDEMEQEGRYMLFTPQKVTHLYIIQKKGTPELSIFFNRSGVDITDRAVYLGILSDTSNRVDTEGKYPWEGRSKGRIFLSNPHTNNGFVLLLTKLFFIYLFILK